MAMEDLIGEPFAAFLCSYYINDFDKHIYFLSAGCANYNHVM